MAEWDRPPDGEGIPSWVNASVMGLSGSASFARPRSRAAEEAASLGVAGEPSDAAETEAARGVVLLVTDLPAAEVLVPRDYIIANRPCHAHACIETRIVVICHGSELRFAPIYNLCSWPAHTKTNYIFPDRNLGRKKLPYGLGCFIAVRRLRPRLCFKGKGTRLEMARPIYNLEA